MLFNSYAFIFAFLPLTFAGYFLLAQRGWIGPAKIWLITASLVFYGWWNIRYVPLLVGLTLFNYAVGTRLHRTPETLHRQRRLLLTLGIAGDLLVLVYFKYTDFFIATVNTTADLHWPLLHIVLPLAISFFTFQKIAYLVDSYRGQVSEYSFLNFCLFVMFFPQLIAGPITHHREIIPQFALASTFRLQAPNLAAGFYLFALGLFKKTIIADSLASWVREGYGKVAQLGTFDAWVTSLAYTFQLYFDFSGYTDMAIGLALLFNIRLPMNFYSPYKARSIQDFWQRWHITLSRFLRDYVYIPLGGNRRGEPATYRNLFLTFLLGGIWHGAGWTFVVWGVLHGTAMVLHRWYSRFGLALPAGFAWLLTFLFVNMAWVFFRAPDVATALDLLQRMFTPGTAPSVFGHPLLPIAALGTCLAVVLLGRNSMQQLESFTPKRSTAIAAAMMAAVSILTLGKVSEFIYFNF